MTTVTKIMNVISRCQGIYRARALDCEGIQACHHTFVLAICRRPGMSQEEIARDICLNKSTVTRALSYLEERGFVRREAKAGDRRALLIYPTDKMEKILPEIMRITREFNDGITEGLTADEIELFHVMLARMQERAKALAYDVERGACEE